PVGLGRARRYGGRIVRIERRVLSAFFRRHRALPIADHLSVAAVCRREPRCRFTQGARHFLVFPLTLAPAPIFPYHVHVDPILREVARASDSGLIPSGSSLVLAVSGGADSMALLYGAHELAAATEWRLVVAHVHHGWRTVSADRD